LIWNGQCAILQAAVVAVRVSRLQTLLSLVDLHYHVPQLPAALSGSSTMWHAVAQQYASLPPRPDTCPQARFSQPLTLFTYSVATKIPSPND
jgi:hypothetical protein